MGWCLRSRSRKAGHPPGDACPASAPALLGRTARWRDGSGHGRLGLGILLLLFVTPMRLSAQNGYELGIQSTAALADQSFVGGGIHAAVRPGGRARFAFMVNAGAVGDRFTVRGEVVGHFLLSPSGLRREVYAGGGLAGVAGGIDEGYLLLVIGIESRPGGRSGWMLETGIGGGVRVVVGYTWRSMKH
jgi:hypothetical protein